MGFKEFKKAQAKQDETQIVKDDNKTKSFKDDRVWTFTKDATNNAKATIRFLPQKDGDKAPFIKLFNHAFKNKQTKRWFIEECPWTIKVSCPVCKYASEVYEQDSSYAKKTWFIANILVVKDELKPENEGKVFLYKFGKEIFKMIQGAVSGNEDKEIDPIKVFNMFEGHNFRIVVKEKKIPGYEFPVNDYSDCFFEKTGKEICDGDEDQQEVVYNSLYDLDEFLDPKRFKSEEELQTKLTSVLSGKTFEKKESKEEGKQEVPKEEKVKPTKSAVKEEPKKEEDDDDDFFNSLDEDNDLPF